MCGTLASSPTGWAYVFCSPLSTGARPGDFGVFGAAAFSRSFSLVENSPEDFPKREARRDVRVSEKTKGRDMSEQRTQSGGSGGRNSLQTDKGNTVIQDGVVSKIAGIAADEVDGVRMGGGASQTANNLLGSITGGSSGGRSQGVSVEVGQEEAAIDLTCTVEYGKSIPQLSEALRRNVVNRVESLVGLRVTEVNVTVSGIYFPQEEAEGQRQRELQRQDSQSGQERRGGQ
jgi:uncharacterized alkaline shock family protein YloU